MRSSRRAASSILSCARSSASALLQLLLDVVDGGRELVLRGHEVLRRVDVDAVALGQELAGQGVELDDALHLVAEEVDADGQSPRRRA